MGTEHRGTVWTVVITACAMLAAQVVVAYFQARRDDKGYARERRKLAYETHRSLYTRIDLAIQQRLADLRTRLHDDPGEEEGREIVAALHLVGNDEVKAAYGNVLHAMALAETRAKSRERYLEEENSLMADVKRAEIRVAVLEACTEPLRELRRVMRDSLEELRREADE